MHDIKSDLGVSVYCIANTRAELNAYKYGIMMGLMTLSSLELLLWDFAVNSSKFLSVNQIILWYTRFVTKMNNTSTYKT